MRERIVTFGPEGSLVGVLTMPEQSRANAPIVLMTNAGVLPRQGPHRLNVRLARALAEAGLASLRFDLSGRGDSRAAGAGGGELTQAVADFQLAMDSMQQTAGVERFLVFGICSGAVGAYHLLNTDGRVAGAFMVDGYAYASRWTTPVCRIKRAMAGSWSDRWHAVRRRLPGAVAVPSGNVTAKPPPRAPDSVFPNPDVTAFRASMQSLVNRGADVAMVITGSELDYYSYAGQFRDVFGRDAFYNKVRCDYCPDIDHTCITKHAQNRMIDLTRAWAVAHLTRSAAAQPES